MFGDKSFKPSLNDINYYIHELVNTYNPYEFEINESECKALIHYARKSRLEFSINKYGSRFKARKSFHSLINRGFLRLELNNDLLSFKRFYPQNKVIFNSNYTRFYFYFLKAMEKIILKDKELALRLINDKFYEYQSFIYEQIACEWCEKKFNIKGIKSIWGKDYECDIFYDNYEISLLGEVKFNGKKMCISSYSKLIQKARYLGFEPDYFILFSKNGFSKKLLALNDKRLILANHENFKEFI
ncbi:ATP-binding protein [Campylobacter sp. RM12647]|uniref:ATP-binding protein n=1 Tax=Campylobacter sp. RM12647 TaxID=2735737 RepID=UPI001D313805|nr:ATP-binding protein [Campylobacter sp. RM12647]